MNKYQIILLIIIILGIYFVLNSKFRMQQFINLPSTSMFDTFLKSKKVNINNDYEKMSMISPKGLYFASGFIGIVAFILLLVSINIINMWFTEYNLAEQSTKWLPLEATVTEKGRQGGTSRSNKSSSSMYYSDNVFYKFQYKGKELKGQRLSYDNGWSTSNASTEGQLLKSVPGVGSQTTIYFNEETGQSVMFPGRQHTRYLALFIATPFFQAGVAISYFALYVFFIGFSLK